jgi:hypothetical protein
MKISKIYLFFLLFSVIFVLAACGKKEEPQVEEEKEEVIVTTATVNDLLEEGRSLYCEASQETEEGFVDLVYYIDNDNNRMRMNSKTFVEKEDMVYNSYFITKEGWSYFWDDFMFVDGFKMKQQESVESNEQEPKVSDEDYANLEEEFKFECQTWKADDSLFVLPTDKSFPSSFNPLEGIQGDIEGMQDIDVEDMQENFSDVDVEEIQDIEIPVW